MARLSNIKSINKTKPFVDTDELRIETHINEQNKITKFVVIKKKPRPQVKEFEVGKDMDILKQWRLVEEFTKELK